MSNEEMNASAYRWRVTHPIHGTAEVVARDRYNAIVAAAKEWGARWTQIARECDLKRLEVASNDK